jgi:hypothetical protein
VSRIQIRRGTAAQWTASNPVLAQGELGYETDTDNVKIGDGSAAWSSLMYINLRGIVDGGSAAATTTDILNGGSA